MDYDWYSPRKWTIWANQPFNFGSYFQIVKGRAEHKLLDALSHPPKRNGRYEVRSAAYIEGPNVKATTCDNMKLWRIVPENKGLLSYGSDEEDQEGRM